MRNATQGTAQTLVKSRTNSNPTLVAIFFSIITLLLAACGTTTPPIDQKAPYEEPQPEVVTPSEWSWTAIGYEDTSPSQLQSSDESAEVVISAGGTDIWGTKDEFYYVYAPLDGDGALSVQVQDLVGADAWSKAGVMLREDLEPDARNVLLHISSENGSVLQSRMSVGAETINSAGRDATAKPGDWVRLSRSGNTVSGELSSDGETWRTVGSYEVEMGASAYIGLAVTAHNPAGTATATFADLKLYRESITPPATPAPGDVEPQPVEPVDSFIKTPSYDLRPATMWVDGTNGSDSNSGRSESAPLRSVTKAATLVQPGDVVYIRGGTYPINTYFTRSGSSSAPIVWASYPGETAVFDGSGQSAGSSQHRVWVDGASHNHFVNFVVRNSPQQGIFVRNGASDNVFYGLVTHANNGSGIQVYGGHRNLFENIVTFDNFDRVHPSGKAGEDADGIGLSSGNDNVLRHIVAYANSDDGFDAWKSTGTIIEYSIAYDNGRGSNGNGNGFKLGGAGHRNNTIARYNIAFNNKSVGFTQNGGLNVTLYNNTAYNNSAYNYDVYVDSKLRNNVSIAGRVHDARSDSSNNTWNLGIDVEVQSTDPSNPNFLALAPGSAAIDRGVDLGLAFLGSAPDLGALEFSTSIVSLRDIRDLLA